MLASFPISENGLTTLIYLNLSIHRNLQYAVSMSDKLDNSVKLWHITEARHAMNIEVLRCLTILRF